MRRSLVLLAVPAFIVGCDRPTAPTLSESVLQPNFAQSAQGAGSSAGGTPTNSRSPFSTIVQNPCTGELVTLTGWFHSVVVSKVDGQTATTKIHANTEDVHGVAIPTGTPYTGSTIEKGDADLTFTPPSIVGQLSERFHLISRGPLDNFFVDILFSATFDGVHVGFVPVKTMSTSCRG